MGNAWPATVMVAASALLLTACDNSSSDRTAGQKLDAAIARTEKAGNETLAKTRELAADARSELKSGELREKIGAAGASISSTVEDTAITAKVHALLLGDAESKQAKVDVETRNGDVVLRGSVPSLVVGKRVEQLALSVNGVSKVSNLLVIATP